MNREELLEHIRQAVREVEPHAEIMLFGSRSRGDVISESDWDFLYLNREGSPQIREAISGRNKNSHNTRLTVWFGGSNI